MKRAPKIICIGAPKTGTTSFHEACVLLGLSSITWARPEDIESGEYEVWGDAPFATSWRAWVVRFPETLFVLTTRDREAWWTSALEHFSRRRELSDVARAYRQAFFGKVFLDETDRDLALGVYDAHLRGVRIDPPRRLLELPVEWPCERKWKAICAAVGCALPAEPYPHTNRRGGAEQTQRLAPPRKKWRLFGR
jgi:hypothetical protein